MMLYPGDVMETDAVIDFLTNEEALELPDKIEAVDDENLFRFDYSKYFSPRELISRVLEEEEHVAVLFYEEKKRDSMKALQHLELIDDEADLFGIR